MIRLLPPPPAEVQRSLEGVLRKAEATGAPAPPWVAVEDAEGRWIREVAAICPTERARGVIVASTHEALATAVRLGVGGALRLPPSTIDATAAFEAAAGHEQTWFPDPGLADLVGAEDGDLLVVGWTNRQFWRCQLGEREMAVWLAELAAELEVLAAVVPWPGLVLPDRSRDDIFEAWSAVIGRRRAVTEGLTVVGCGPVSGHCGVAAHAISALMEHDRAGPVETGQEVLPRPVYELPNGRPVGWWSPSEPASPPDEGWCAVPEVPTPEGFRWQLHLPDRSTEPIDDLLDPSQIRPPAARVPGWIAVSVAPGRPAGLLVEEMAQAADRQGAPLWLPNLGQPALAMLLRLPGTFWVDGPAAPRAEVVDSSRTQP